MKIISFDIWGDYGHFRKYYTTSSPLTFSFPPPSTIRGILGSIFGVNQKDEYLRIFSHDVCKVSLRIINPIKKVRIGINLINTKDNKWTLYRSKYHDPRTQIKFEFLKDPHYRIYIFHKDENIFKNIVSLLKEHRSIYTVSLGLSELLADFKYIGEYEGAMMSSTEKIDISTPIVLNNLINGEFEIENEKKYCKEKLPIKMTQERIVEEYSDIIFELQGNSMKARLKEFCKLDNGENIAFF